MQSDKLAIKTINGKIIFYVQVQPRASRNKVAGLYGDALKVRLAAPPVDGAANKMLTAFMSKVLDVPKSAVEIGSGHSGRRKKILVDSAGDIQGLKARLLAIAGAAT